MDRVKKCVFKSQTKYLKVLLKLFSFHMSTWPSPKSKSISQSYKGFYPFALSYNTHKILSELHYTITNLFCNSKIFLQFFFLEFSFLYVQSIVLKLNFFLCVVMLSI